MMKLWDSAEPFATLMAQLEQGREFSRCNGQGITDAKIISKGITLLTNNAVLNPDIKE